jgi:hypothetical protein
MYYDEYEPVETWKEFIPFFVGGMVLAIVAIIIGFGLI